MLRDSVEYTFQREPLVRHVMSGSFIAFLQLLIIGTPLYLGYFTRIVNDKVKGDGDEPPGFQPILPLIKDGVVSLLIGLSLIGIPFSALYALELFVGFTSVALSYEELGVLIVALSLLSILLITAAYITPACLCLYARTKNPKSAYEISEIRRFVLSRNYLRAYVYFVIISIVAGLAAQSLVSTVIGLPLAAVVWFVYICAAGYIFGTTTRDIYS